MCKGAPYTHMAMGETRCIVPSFSPSQLANVVNSLIIIRWLLAWLVNVDDVVAMSPSTSPTTATSPADVISIVIACRACRVARSIKST